MMSYRMPLLIVLACIVLLSGCATVQKTPVKVLNQGPDISPTLAEEVPQKGLKRKVAIARFSNETNFKRSQLFVKECLLNGVYFAWHHNMFLSTAHTKKDIEQTLDVADKAFSVVKKQFGS